VIPVYNGAKRISGQLGALIAQQYAGKWEIIVVDNNSTDNLAEVIDTWKQCCPRLRMVAAPARQSRSYARNVGAQAAHGDAFLFCDDDDIVAPGWLMAFGAALREHHLIAGMVETKKLNHGGPWRPAPSSGAKHKALGFLPYVISCNMAVSRAAFEAVGGFDEEVRVGQDIDISWRLHLAGYPVVDAPDAVVHYRFRSNMEDLLKQMVQYSEAHVFLYKRFRRHGMHRRSAHNIWRQYYWLLRNITSLLRSRSKREYWLVKAAVCCGHIRGSLRYGILYL
jgi:glycosyltransferase involved in cell wall biosynthesis